jgi:hypothetical protein
MYFISSLSVSHTMHVSAREKLSETLQLGQHRSRTLLIFHVLSAYMVRTNKCTDIFFHTGSAEARIVHLAPHGPWGFNPFVFRITVLPCSFFCAHLSILFANPGTACTISALPFPSDFS